MRLDRRSQNMLPRHHQLRSPAAPRRSRPNRGAFTLVEILCVIVILGIASALIIPQIGTRDDLKAAAAARLIISDLMYAQNLAISKQRKHYVQFTGQQYTLLSRDADTDPLVAIIHPVDKGNYVTAFGTNRAGARGRDDQLDRLRRADDHRLRRPRLPVQLRRDDGRAADGGGGDRGQERGLHADGEGRAVHGGHERRVSTGTS